ncbi:BrnT family toxin [Candidatus Magnetominusculus xianensis]|uniref:BrnT family toxin n=1 Tax=Candidatus Magnetominusculus xianensis TaxID=1748249 RepID=A0ABR5SHQ7_9BACT|nr:BrnT family toxin [Candidatus Magnetominusculus xianensis]KWT91690.1 hypothetical protein ASN18_0808 [Candidatus Magnetominusculus xianensis]MBF0404554.1 BrnT family toxin [Nitrospirota bacterium]
MIFEWSEQKRQSVLKARNLDFIDARYLFDGRRLCTVPSPRGTEQRWLSIGDINGKLIAVVWTWRDDAIRIITMRRARDEEKRRYQALHG